MNIRKFILGVTAIMLSLNLLSCNSLRSKLVKERASQLNLKDDKEIANECFDKVIECLKNKDKEGLKKMFSPNALEEADDIDGGIDYIIDFYKGEIESKDVALQVSDHKDDGEKTSEMKAFYTVETDEDTYIVFFINKTVDIKNPDNIGFYMLQIIKKSDREIQFDWGGSKTRCAGIYRPDDVK